MIIAAIIIITTVRLQCRPRAVLLPQDSGHSACSQQWSEELVTKRVLTSPAETLTCAWDTPPLPREGLHSKAILYAMPALALFERDVPTSIYSMTPTNP